MNRALGLYFSLSDRDRFDDRAGKDCSHGGFEIDVTKVGEREEGEFYHAKTGWRGCEDEKESKTEQIVPMREAPGGSFELKCFVRYSIRPDAPPGPRLVLFQSRLSLPRICAKISTERTASMIEKGRN